MYQLDLLTAALFLLKIKASPVITNHDVRNHHDHHGSHARDALLHMPLVVYTSLASGPMCRLYVCWTPFSKCVGGF
jgi:hypothetical protein